MQTIKCSSCGGELVDGKQKYHHLKRCLMYQQEGIDHLICKVCGYKSPILTQHLRIHKMSVQEYRIKFPFAPVQLESAIKKRNQGNIGKLIIPIPNRAGAILCDKCNEWYLKRFAAKHLSDCVAIHPDKYFEGKDYVKCPECGIAMSRLGEHLKKEHGWDKDRIVIEAGRGLKLMAKTIAEKWKAKQDFSVSQEKREKTHFERHGYSNPFSNPEVKKGLVETSQRRYGVGHPMQNEEIFIRQSESAQRGPSEQERFFDEHTCPNVVFCGYGGRFIRTKTGVHKYGRLIKDLNPDFIVLSDNVLESALMVSKEHKPMDRQKHRSRYVIELLGDYYHSEAVTGVKPEEHEREIIEAYKSAGIECLVLWEKDVMIRWESIRSMVDAWIEKAITDMNEKPVWSRAKRL
jgi:hypothetical protein